MNKNEGGERIIVGFDRGEQDVTAVRKENVLYYVGSDPQKIREALKRAGEKDVTPLLERQKRERDL